MPRTIIFGCTLVTGIQSRAGWDKTEAPHWLQNKVMPGGGWKIITEERYSSGGPDGDSLWVYEARWITSPRDFARMRSTCPTFHGWALGIPHDHSLTVLHHSGARNFALHAFYPHVFPL